LLAAGIGRTWIELFFRPDQPKIPGLGISYSAIVAASMAIVGAVMLMARYKAINLKFAENWEEEYQISGTMDQVGGKSIAEMIEEEQPVRESEAPAAKKVVKRESLLQKKARQKIAARKAAKESYPRTPRAKKTSE